MPETPVKSINDGIIEWSEAIKDNRVLLVFDDQMMPRMAEEVASLINYCSENRLKVLSINTDVYLTWQDIEGKPMQVSNLHQNKALFTFTKMP